MIYVKPKLAFQIRNDNRLTDNQYQTLMDMLYDNLDPAIIERKYNSMIEYYLFDRID